MSRKYNRSYKKGKFNTSNKSKLADYSRVSKRVLRNTPANRKLWATDTRKYDLAGVDTPDWYNEKRGFKKIKPFKYKYKTKKKLGKKVGRENQSYRRYYVESDLDNERYMRRKRNAKS